MRAPFIQELTAVIGLVTVFLTGTVLGEDEVDETHVVLLGSNLTCHSCYNTEDNDKCVYFRDSLDIEHCRPEQPFCMVHMQKTDDKMVSFERGCAKECEPGCSKIGSLMTVEHCYICCQESDCNYENIQTSKLSRLIVGVLSTVLPLILALFLS